jgi:hypothetical protein
MKDAGNLLSAMKTVCRPEIVLPARGHGIAAKNRRWRDAASAVRAAACGRLLIVQGALDGRVEAPGRKIGLDASIDRLRAVLLKPRVQFLDSRGESAPMARSIS